MVSDPIFAEIGVEGGFDQGEEGCHAAAVYNSLPSDHHLQVHVLLQGLTPLPALPFLCVKY